MRTLARGEDKAELLDRLRCVRPESARRWGRMTAQQMLCHLADSFRVGNGQRPFRPADSAFSRTVLKWGALYLPLRWPPGIATRPEVDPLREGTPPGDFGADRSAVEIQLEIFAASTSLDRRAHPLFGRMSSAAWLRWGWLHTDHHLRQFGL